VFCFVEVEVGLVDEVDGVTSGSADAASAYRHRDLVAREGDGCCRDRRSDSMGDINGTVERSSG
jgi:hypothetical protein